MINAYLAPTKEKWEELVKEHLEKGYEWFIIGKEINLNYWSEYEENSVLYFNEENKEISCGNKEYTKKKHKTRQSYNLTWLTDKTDDTESMIKKLQERGYTVEKKMWKPELNQEHWYVGNTGVYRDVWINGVIDDRRLNNFGVYRTKELAQEAFDKMKVVAQEVMSKN